MGKNMIPTGEALRLLGIDRRTLWRWGKTGKLPVQRDFRGWRYFNLRDVLRLKNTIEPSRVGSLGKIPAAFRKIASLLRSIISAASCRIRGSKRQTFPP